MDQDVKKSRLKGYQPILMMIVTGIQIAYAAVMILKYLQIGATLDLVLLVEPIMLFSLAIYVAILYFGISFLRIKTYGWYGETALYIILSLKGILFFISTITVGAFKGIIGQYFSIPVMNFNSKVVWAVIELLVALFMVKQLFTADTMNGFSFKRRTKGSIIIAVSAMVIFAVILYFFITYLIIAYR